jgi:hypothetical protein
MHVYVEYKIVFSKQDINPDEGSTAKTFWNSKIIPNIDTGALSGVSAGLALAIDAYLNSQKAKYSDMPESKPQSLKIQRCPVCEGRGTMPNGFYARTSFPGLMPQSNPVPRTEVCKSCDGKGYI